MMTSYFNLLKYAATGIASPDMTYYDKIRASTLMGGALQTLTGIPPLSFKADGSPLISWSMKGNSSQSGTPTPDNPVMPEFVGVKTGNLFDDNNAEFGKWVNDNGSIETGATYAAGYGIKVGTASKFAIKHYGDKPYSYSMAFYDSNGDFLSRVHRSSPSGSYDTFPVPENAVSARFQVAVNTSKVMTSAILKAMKLMLNIGSTALPYEPFGWAIPLSCAGQTTPVYLGQVSTVRRIKKLVLTGEENWNEGTSNYYIFINVSGRGEGIPNSTALCTHTESGVVVNNNGTALFFKKSVFVHTSAADFKSYLAAQYAAGTPVTVWYVLSTEQTGITNEPLCKISTYADELSSTDAGVSIPTVKGSNVLTVDTTLQPSEMSITYRG